MLDFTLRTKLRIGDITVVTIGKTEILADFRDAIQLVVRTIRTELVLSVLDEPKFSRLRVPIETHAVAYAAGEDFLIAAVGIAPQDNAVTIARRRFRTNCQQIRCRARLSP